MHLLNTTSRCPVSLLSLCMLLLVLGIPTGHWQVRVSVGDTCWTLANVSVRENCVGDFGQC